MGQFRTFDQVESETIRMVHDYWDRLRGERRFPAKREIDPGALKPVLPYLMISEVYRDPLRVRYRLVGTEAVHFAGEDFTGKWLHETEWGEYAESIEEKYRRLFDTGAPVFGVDYFVQRSDGKRKPYEWAIFPLASDAGWIDFCLLVEDYQPLNRFEAPLRPGVTD